MNEGINYFEHFYQQALQDFDLLERNANDYPYSSLTGFLLLYHYKKTNHPGFDKLAKKTVLHFKNANWLQFLLDQASNEETGPGIKSGFLAETQTINETNSDEIIQILPDAGSGIEIEEVAENRPSNTENFEIYQRMEIDPVTTGSEAAQEILPEQNVQEEHLKAVETADPPGGEIISFEPLHTVDYFASQGIKITDEPVTTDKLGNQMKSFTAWLKSMKKFHPSKLEEQDVVTDKLIQNSAEESNVNTEVLTEAMAEVLIKQDKKEKAIDMYNKLSLINPSKSAYFAAKIESIKLS